MSIVSSRVVPPPPGKTQNFQFLAKNFPPQASEKVSPPPPSKNTIFKENFQIYRIFSTDHHTPDIILTDNQTQTPENKISGKLKP